MSSSSSPCLISCSPTTRRPPTATAYRHRQRNGHNLQPIPSPAKHTHALAHMSQQSSPTQSCPPSSTELFVDLFADVSQHGPSMLELFASQTMPANVAATATTSQQPSVMAAAAALTTTAMAAPVPLPFLSSTTPWHPNGNLSPTDDDRMSVDHVQQASSSIQPNFSASNNLNNTASSETLSGLMSSPSSVALNTSATPQSPHVTSPSTPVVGSTTTPKATATATTPRRRSGRQNPNTPKANGLANSGAAVPISSNLQSSIAKPPQRSKRPSSTGKQIRSSVPPSSPLQQPSPQQQQQPSPSNIGDSEEASEASDEQAPHLSSNALPPTPKKPPLLTAKQLMSNAEPSVLSDPPVKQAHNSHTRRCRAKVNSKFKELMQILPPPSNGIKHKAQILEYTIQIFRDYHAKKMSLEAELALSSRAHLNAWVEGVVTRSLSLQELLLPYLSLICTKGGWKYSEAWVSAQDDDAACNGGGGGGSNGTTGISGHSRLLTPANSAIGPNSKLRLGPTLIPPLGNTDDPDLQSKLERFRDRSRSYGCKARVDLPGRILCTMRPEWLPSLEDTDVFQRARLATDASLTMCFGVPVFIRGYVAAVAMFFDTEKRAYDAKCVDLADYVASLLGSSFGQTSLRQAQCR